MAYPLTTSFTPPTSCFDGPWTSASGYSTGFPVLFRENNNACRPPGENGAIAYSPGMCPVGFETAKATASASETYAVCCPSGYAADGDSLCSSTGTAATTIDCIYTAGIINLCNSGTVPSGAVFFQNNIEVIYRQADLTLFPSGYQPGPVATGEIPRITSIVTSPTHHGPSKGAIAGIIVGLVVFIMMQVGILYYLCFVRRRRSLVAGKSTNTNAQTDIDDEEAYRAKVKELELEE